MYRPRFKFVAILVASLYMAISFLGAKPAHAFTSLQSCYANPVCAKMLVDAGMVGAASAPAGVATTAAPAASVIVPNFGNALGLGVGVAALKYAWDANKAQQLADYYVAPFEGGQSPGVLYGVVVGFRNGDTVVPEWATYFTYGPVGGISNLVNPNETKDWWIDGNTQQGQDDEVRFISNANPAWEFYITRTFRQDGQEDTGPDLAPPLLRDQVPSPAQLDELFGPAETVPWPSPEPGPDGEIGTDDDVYPPLSIPGPHISVDSNRAPYVPGDFEANNELDLDVEINEAPNFDPSDFDGDGQPNDVDVNLDLNPAPGQSSGCDGWGYAICQLSGRFPFDVVGDLPTSIEPGCPQFEFFGQSAEFCFVNTLLGYLKWVVGISMLIYGVMTL